MVVMLVLSLKWEINSTMLRLLVLTLTALTLFGQTPKSIAEAQIEHTNKQRDFKLLRGVSKFRIGAVGVTNVLAADAGRKLLLDSLVRYNVPVEWTSTSSSGYPIDVPIFFLTSSCTRSTCANTCTVVTCVFRLEVFDTALLQGVAPVKCTTTIWSAEETVDFDPNTNKDDTIDIFKRLADKFSLSSLAANR
jgi:hypothetical protein